MMQSTSENAAGRNVSSLQAIISIEPRRYVPYTVYFLLGDTFTGVIVSVAWFTSSHVHLFSTTRLHVNLLELSVK